MYLHRAFYFDGDFDESQYLGNNEIYRNRFIRIFKYMFANSDGLGTT